MYNFFNLEERMKNFELEDENDLTRLTLKIGSPMRETHSFPSPSPSPSTLTTPQTSFIPLMEIQTPFANLSLNPNPNPNVFLMLSSNHNPNLLFFPSSDNHNTNILQDDAANVDVNTPTPTPSFRRTQPKRSKKGKRETFPVPSKKGKVATVAAPFPWATNRRATIHSRRYLLQNNIHTIKGKVYCKSCEKEFEMSVDVEEKVNELRRFIERQRGSMHDRAPKCWFNPVLRKCVQCGRENSAKPVINKKREINWLFLLLTQTVGCCKLQHLKFFCKHTNTHRTGAKDRLLYLIYMNLCKQLIPDWVVR